jgi:hypothetical protein
MEKLNRKIDEILTKIFNAEYGWAYFIAFVVYFIFSSVISYDLFYDRGMNDITLKSALFISTLFNLFIVFIFGLKLYDIIKNPIPEPQEYSLSDIKAFPSLISKLSRKNADRLLKESIKEEVYIFSHLITKHLNKLNRKKKV